MVPRFKLERFHIGVSGTLNVLELILTLWKNWNYLTKISIFLKFSQMVSVEVFSCSSSHLFYKQLYFLPLPPKQFLLLCKMTWLIVPSDQFWLKMNFLYWLGIFDGVSKNLAILFAQHTSAAVHRQLVYNCSAMKCAVVYSPLPLLCVSTRY